jgi:CheY-like chemotaxis protein
MTRILCLDDDSDMVNLLSLALKRAGYEVLTTTSSYKALDILRHQPIDLLTQDFMRPDLDGLEFLKILKSDAALRDIPVLGVSARPRDPRAEEMKRVGLDLERDLAGYVTKPYSPFELLEAVEAALTKHGKAIPAQAAQVMTKYRGQQSAETDRTR